MPRASFLRGPYPAKPTPPSSTAAPLLRGNITNNTNRNNTTPASAAAIQHGTPAVSTISTTSTTTSATTTFAAPHTTVEDKLHAAAAALKKSRDTAHRDHQVAIERLRLVEDEIATLTAAVEQAQFQCERMTAQMPSVRDDVAAAKRAVEHLAQKVNMRY